MKPEQVLSDWENDVNLTDTLFVIVGCLACWTMYVIRELSAYITVAKMRKALLPSETPANYRLRLPVAFQQSV